MNSCEDPFPDDDTDCIDPAGVPLPSQKPEGEIRPYLQILSSGCSDPGVYGFAF